MFSAPSIQTLKTEMFVSLPESFRRVSRGKPARISLEGPSFDRAGNLYFTDIPSGRIFRAGPDGTLDLVAEYDGEPNGLKIHQDGRIFVADHRNGIMLLDPASGAVTPHCIGPANERFKGVNDLCFGRNGDLFFTDQGQTGLNDPTGRVYRLTATGQLSCLIDNAPSPNGLVLNRSERVLYVAMTRANAIWLVPVGQGGASKVGLFVQLPCPGPDGMALDAEGNLYVAHPGLGVIWGIDRRGIPIFRIESCAGARTLNLCFGGEGNRWLYVTEAESGSILRAEMPVPGARMYSHHDIEKGEAQC